MKGYILVLLFLLCGVAGYGQDDQLFHPGEEKRTRKGLIINGNGSFDLPAGDMAKRFGLSYRVGPAFLYKTSSNWLFGAKFDFIMGGKIKEDSLMINITDRYSQHGGSLYEFIDQDGKRIGIPVFERGYAVGIQAGKIIALSPRRPDNGILLMGTVGFMQHRINIFDRNKTVYQLRGSLVKGYDRLTNGVFVEGFAGYVFFSNNGLLNFNLGFDCLVGFTQGRRDYLYDVMRPDNAKRIDVLYGLRLGWYIPAFKRRSEDISFE